VCKILKDYLTPFYNNIAGFSGLTGRVLNVKPPNCLGVVENLMKKVLKASIYFARF
jgi:hypothetical protein